MDNLTRGSQRINVTTDKKRYGKVVTVVSGFDKDVDVKKIAKALKKRALLAVELQRTTS